MANFALILLCLGLGIGLRLSGRLPGDAHLTLNGVIVNIALPALAFASVRKLSFDAALCFAVAMPWLVFAFGAGFFLLVARAFHFSRATTGGLVLTGALGNTSFVGLPMIETFFGREAMHVGLLIDQLGSYLVLSTLGLVAAAAFSGGRATPADVLARLVRFPPLLAMVAGALCTGLPIPEWVDAVLMRLADSIPALAMLSVGCQLRFADLAGNRSALAIGLGFKLVFVPFLIAPLYLGLLPETMHATARIAIFESAMAPMIGAGIVAMQYKLNAPLVSLMLGVGIPLSLMTVPAWWYALGTV
ncbi:MAG: AEC family transporter [Caldimonas sp.]